MAFANGSDLVTINNNNKIITVLPVNSVASINPLVPGTHRVVISDPTTGSKDYTLPDAASSDAVQFVLKRNTFTDGVNFVRLLPAGSDTIDGTNEFILGNRNESVHVISDGTTIWKVLDSRTFAVAALQFSDASPATQVLTTGFQKIDAWNTDLFTTPGRVESDQANNKFSVLNIQADPEDGYKVFYQANIEFANNVDLNFAVFVDGVETEVGLTVTGKGSNEVLVTFNGVVPVLKAGGEKDIDIRVNPATGNTITYNSKMNALVERIGG